MINTLKKITSLILIHLLFLNSIAWSYCKNNTNKSFCKKSSFIKLYSKNCIAPKTTLIEVGINEINQSNINGILLKIKNIFYNNVSFKTKLSDYILPITISLYSLSLIIPNEAPEKQKSFLFFANFTTLSKVSEGKILSQETLLNKINNTWYNNHIIIKIVKKYWLHYTGLVFLGFIILGFQSIYLKGAWWTSMNSLVLTILFANMGYAVATFLFGDYLAQKIDRNDIETNKDFLRIKVMGLVGFISKIPYFIYLGLFMPYTMISLKNYINLNEAFDPIIRFFIHQFIWLYPYNAFRYFIRDLLYLIAENAREFKKNVLENLIEFVKKPFKINKLAESIDETIRLLSIISFESFYKLKKQSKPVNYWDIFSPLTVQYIGHTIFIGPTMLIIFLMAGDHAFVLSSIITGYHVIIISHLMFLKKEQKVPDLFKDSDFQEWVEKNKKDKNIMQAWNQLRLYIVAKDLSLHHKKTENIIKNGLELLLPGKFKDNFYPKVTSYEEAFSQIENLYNLSNKTKSAA